MKMVIVESEKKSAVVLRDDGQFIKIPQRGYRVGQTLEVLPAPKSIRQLPRAAVAAVLALILLSGSGALAVRLPYSYVTMDINPSVKYTLNVFDRVLAISAVNTDAEAVVQALSQEDTAYEKLDDVIEMTIAQCRTDGYLYKDAEDVVVLSVMSISNSKTDTLAKALGSHSYGDGLISAEVVSSTIDALKNAEQQGTTPGKLAIISKMQEKTGNNGPAADWINAPVRDIISVVEGAASEMPVSSQPSDSQTTSDKTSPPEGNPQVSSASDIAGQPSVSTGDSDLPSASDGTESGKTGNDSGKHLPKDGKNTGGDPTSGQQGPQADVKSAY